MVVESQYFCPKLVTVFISAFKITGQVHAGKKRPWEIRAMAGVFYEGWIRSAKVIGETYTIFV
jgi:hypothetical protein